MLKTEIEKTEVNVDKAAVKDAVIRLTVSAVVTAGAIAATNYVINKIKEANS
jgi:hypothetical protein